MAGFQRAVGSMAKKREGNFPPCLDFHPHIVGAIGEMAVSKHYALYWPPAIGVFNTKNDVPGMGFPVDVKTKGREFHKITWFSISESEYMDIYKGFVFVFVGYFRNECKIFGALESEKLFDVAELCPKTKEHNPSFYKVYTKDLVPLEHIMLNKRNN